MKTLPLIFGTLGMFLIWRRNARLVGTSFSINNYYINQLNIIYRKLISVEGQSQACSERTIFLHKYC